MYFRPIKNGIFHCYVSLPEGSTNSETNSIIERCTLDLKRPPYWKGGNSALQLFSILEGTGIWGTC